MTTLIVSHLKDEIYQVKTLLGKEVHQGSPSSLVDYMDKNGYEPIPESPSFWVKEVL